MFKCIFKILTAVLVILALLLTAACGSQKDNQSAQVSSETETPSSNATDESTHEKKEPVTLTLSTFNGWSGDALKAGIKIYEDSTGNKIEYQLYPDDQFFNLIKAKLATGDVPDIISLWNKACDIPADEMEPLDGPWAAKLSDTARKMGTRTSDGKLIAAIYVQVPYMGLVYNKDVFSKYGISIPLRTHTDFMNACETFKKDGITPLEIYNPGHIYFLTLMGSGYIYENDPTIAEKIMKNELKPQDSPAFEELYKRLLAIKEKGYLNKDFMNAKDCSKRVAAGTSAMTPDGTWSYAGYKKDYGDKADTSIGFMPFTFGDNYIAAVALNNGKAFMVPKASKKKDAAKEFINYMLQDDVLKAMFEIDPGACPYKGIDTKKSPWDKEMEGYVAAGMPTTDDFRAQYFFGYDMDAGVNVSEKVIAGKDIKATLTEWYEAYAKVAKAKGTPGF